ncbi:hypothetical protein BDP81DRAFT_419833 [Colletotrichum phormii]|uniref:Uncharacterized protein n=1 Tax=Colletotrichum phormii TaxID=359342 RepID=A0AAJ0A0K6_9PEZI|nr:uncharacterized protein BDP81DRAFT_419833 [Colletotrichum phormii]KAK1640338.1 hypothetical protein BDP81DRAFT_419833 [Colletotrichum phormii]
MTKPSQNILQFGEICPRTRITVIYKSLRPDGKTYSHPTHHTLTFLPPSFRRHLVHPPSVHCQCTCIPNRYAQHPTTLSPPTHGIFATTLPCSRYPPESRLYLPLIHCFRVPHSSTTLLRSTIYSILPSLVPRHAGCRYPGTHPLRPTKLDSSRLYETDFIRHHNLSAEKKNMKKKSTRQKRDTKSKTRWNRGTQGRRRGKIKPWTRGA